MRRHRGGCHGAASSQRRPSSHGPQLAEEVAHGTGARSAILDGEIWNECQSLQPSVGWGELMKIGKRAYDECHSAIADSLRL